MSRVERKISKNNSPLPNLQDVVHRADTKKLNLSFISQELVFSINTLEKYILPTPDNKLSEKFKKLPLFSISHDHRIQNVMEVPYKDTRIMMFDFTYTPGEEPMTQTVILFYSEQLNLPLFTLRPESMFDTIKQFLGFKDIDFDNCPIFSELYFLKGNDEGAIRHLFDEKKIKFYEAHKDVNTEGSGNFLIFYRHRIKVEPASIPLFLEEGVQVLNLFHSNLIRIEVEK